MSAPERETVPRSSTGGGPAGPGQPSGGSSPREHKAPAQTGVLQDMDKTDLVAMKNKVLYEQAVQGKEPGLSIMRDKLGGENKVETWGMTPTIMEPDEQN